MEKESHECLTTANQMMMMKANTQLTKLGIARVSTIHQGTQGRVEKVSHECLTVANPMTMIMKTNTQLTKLGIDRVSTIYHGRQLLLFVGCLTSQQQPSVSQGRICSDNFTCCHTETEVADPTFYLTQSQYTDTGPTSPSTDPISPGAWQSSHWKTNV